MTPRIILLASYPKSGNTWLRLVLSNLLYPAQAPVAINEIPLGMRWLRPGAVRRTCRLAFGRTGLGGSSRDAARCAAPADGLRPGKPPT